MAHLERGTLEGARVLAPESYETMWAVQVHERGEAIESALGWWVRQGSPERIVEHDGEDDGFSSHFCLWPERQQRIVLLCSTSGVEPGDLTAQVAELPDANQ